MRMMREGRRQRRKDHDLNHCSNFDGGMRIEETTSKESAPSFSWITSTSADATAAVFLEFSSLSSNQLGSVLILVVEFFFSLATIQHARGSIGLFNFTHNFKV